MTERKEEEGMKEERQRDRVTERKDQLRILMVSFGWREGDQNSGESHG